MRQTIISSLLAGLLLQGCSMIPDYQRPDYSATGEWQNIPESEQPADNDEYYRLSWQEFFSDPALRNVIGKTLENNRDLKQAALNIDEARALYRINRADLFPSVNAGVFGNVSESSDRSSATGAGTKTELYQANIGITAYELDLFGRIRSQNEAALNAYFATQQAHAVVRNVLIAEVTNAYLQLLADQKLLSLTEKTLETQTQAHHLLTKSWEKGVATQQDVARAKTSVETAQVNLHRFRRFVEQDKNALYLLIGVPQDQFTLPPATLDDIDIKEMLPPNLPSAVLLARPDVRQAEYNLRGRNADIGAARAAFFPSISLTGSLGFASQEMGSLFANGASGAWSLVPSITVPIFNSGRNRANLDIAEIRKEKAVIDYEHTIEIAFREVADELAARATLQDQLAAQQRLVDAATTVYTASKARHQSGIDSYLSVLDAQRELYTHQQNAIDTERERLVNLVNLYKVLGGGG